MAVIGPTASSDDVELGKCLAQGGVAAPQINGVSLVELFGFVEFRVTLRGRIRTQATDAVSPRLVSAEDLLEMGWVSTIDHVVGDGSIRRAVYGPNGIA